MSRRRRLPSAAFLVMFLGAATGIVLVPAQPAFAAACVASEAGDCPGVECAGKATRIVVRGDVGASINKWCEDGGDFIPPCTRAAGDPNPKVCQYKGSSSDKAGPMHCESSGGAEGFCENVNRGKGAAGVFVFTASATVNDPLYAPVSPACGVALCPDPGSTGYSFDSNNGGQFGQFCAGAVVDITTSGLVHVGVRQGGGDVAGTTCQLASTGTVTGSPSVAPTLGPWCGLSSGSGAVTGKVGTVGSEWNVPAGTTVQWVTSAGTVLPLVLSIDQFPAGAGAVQTTGAQPGTCGLVPPAFLPTTSFTVTGFSAFVA